MRRTLVLSALLALALAAPAQAQEPAPSVIEFAAGRPTPITQGGGTIYTGGSVCEGTGIGSGGSDGGPFLRLPAEPNCHARVYFSFQAGQAGVALWVRAQSGAGVSFNVCGQILCDGDEVASTRFAGIGEWRPVVLSDPAHQPTIFSGYMDVTAGALDIDDVSFSPVRQPGTTIVSGPDTLVEGATGRFAFASTTPRLAYFCSKDGGAYDLCGDGLEVTAAGVGRHTVSVYVTDVFGRTDPTPATATYTVVPAPPSPPAPPAPPADGDGDGVPDAVDNCPAAANTDQVDVDVDAVGNVCDPLAPGNVPPVAGVSTVVRQISGEVFVKLPVPSRLGFRGMRAPFQESGFISLKGVASVPVGSTVDTRKGEIGMEGAANGFAASDRRARRQSARIKAGMFAIKQARARRRVARAARIPLDVDLLSPPRAEAACVRGPAKGVVRTMSMAAKGFIRALGGASTATARDATFNTTDRCDGTLTEVGRGRVSLAVKGRRKPIVVRSGRAYLVKAKIFQIRKGRRKPGVR